MQQASTTLDIGAMVTGLGGGLALFLFGMRQMTEALKTVAGGSMKNLLARLTANRFTGVLAGAIVTGVIQSSTVTTVLVVGFLTAGLMNFTQSIGVIIGANVGTTITAQIIAFQIYRYGLLMIAVGFATNIGARRVRTKQYGLALMGLGLIFFGMELMTVAMGPLGEYRPFVDAMAGMTNPFLGILAGMVFTALVQSSSATTGLVIVLAGEGLVTVDMGIALVFGANIGTCVTAVLSAFGRPREAVQAAMAHVIFNVVGVALWVLFIPRLAGVVARMAPGDTSRQIANAHTLFNVGNAMLFIWFTGPLSRLVERLVPRIVTAVEVGKPRFLDEYFIDQPALALDRVRMELGRLAEAVGAMLHQTASVVLTGDPDRIARLRADDKAVNALQGAIVLYLGHISQQHLVDPQSGQTYQYILVANHLETIGDIIDKNLMASARKRIRLGVEISPATAGKIRELHEKVSEAFDQVTEAIRSDAPDQARVAARSKGAVNKVAREATAYLADRLVADEPNRLSAFQVESDIVEDLRRLNNLTRRIARILLEEQTEGSAATAAEKRSEVEVH